MDLSLDRRIVLNPLSQHKPLYDWSLHEVGDDGEAIDGDWIPWPWTLGFIADELSVTDGLFLSKFASNGDERIPKRRQFISARLRSFGSRTSSPTRYSMFGTDRLIDEFALYISPYDEPMRSEHGTVSNLSEEDASENDGDVPACAAYGGVAFTSKYDDGAEDDLPDFLEFHLYIDPSVFADYVRRVIGNRVERLTLEVEGVAGFYAYWSPEVVTNSVKILAASEDHAVEAPEGCKISPPRLGNVEGFGLTLSNAASLSGASQDYDDQVLEEGLDNSFDDDSESASVPPEVKVVVRLLLRMSRHLEWLKAIGIAIVIMLIILVLTS